MYITSYVCAYENAQQHGRLSYSGCRYLYGCFRSVVADVIFHDFQMFYTVIRFETRTSEPLAVKIITIYGCSRIRPSVGTYGRGGAG